MQYDLDFIVNACRGKTKSSPQRAFLGFSTDNRDPEIAGKLFIPLQGDNHDAHSFVKAAIEAGAAGALVHHWKSEWDPLLEKATFIEVGDTLKALQDFSKAWRSTFQGKVLALTGSNGKTTTKDFLFQILKNFGSVNASHGSFNNHWGVPFTLLDSDPRNDYCVVEMGMNHSGEIARLMTIADPDLVTVTNVGRAHMGNFENGIQGVARAKEEIYELAKASAQLIFNVDNSWTQEMYKKYMDRPSFTYSTKNFSTDVYFKIKEKTPAGLIIEGQIGGVLGQSNLGFWGDHNVENLAAAVALAYVGGVRPEKIWPVLKECHSGWGRNQWIETQSGLQILFDGYNANPDSFQALLQNVSELTQTKKCVALFGEMLELGEQALVQHQELGEKVSHSPWSHCFFIGDSKQAFSEGFAKNGNSKSLSVFSNFDEFKNSDWLSLVSDADVVLIKGSRGGALERAIPLLRPLSWSGK